jgi:hypothetical protein
MSHDLVERLLEADLQNSDDLGYFAPSSYSYEKINEIAPSLRVLFQMFKVKKRMMRRRSSVQLQNIDFVHLHVFRDLEDAATEVLIDPAKVQEVVDAEMSKELLSLKLELRVF